MAVAGAATGTVASQGGEGRGKGREDGRHSRERGSGRGLQE